MLQGKRMYTDDEVEQVITEALILFDKLALNYSIPEDLREITFQSVLNLVGTRDLTAELIASRIAQGQPIQ